MSEITIGAKSEKIVNIPYGQKIAIGTYGGGIASIYYQSEFGNIPQAYYLSQRIQNQQVILGTFPNDVNIKIVSGDTVVLYEIGLNPSISSDILPDGFGPLSGNRNKIINGNFDVWQRGTSFADISGAAYLADRWAANTSGATVTYSQQTFTPGQTDVSGEPTYFIRCNATIADDLWGIVQRIENVRTFAGQTFTLSFYAKANAIMPMRLLVRQDFGSGGSTDVDHINNDFSLTTLWSKYVWTITLASISGKTIGSDDSLQLYILNNENTTGTIDIAQVQAESGSIATSFEERLFANELSLCQRYCWQGRSVASGNAFLYASAGDANMYANGASFPVTMRSTPTMSIVTAPTYDNCSNNSLSTFTTGYAHRVDVTATGKYRAYNGVYRADAEL